MSVPAQARRTDHIDIAPDQYMNLELAALICKRELEEARSKKAKKREIVRPLHVVYLSDVKCSKGQEEHLRRGSPGA